MNKLMNRETTRRRRPISSSCTSISSRKLPPLIDTSTCESLPPLEQTGDLHRVPRDPLRCFGCAVATPLEIGAPICPERPDAVQSGKSKVTSPRPAAPREVQSVDADDRAIRLGSISCLNSAF
jgi:hypothetical protein